VSSYKPLTTAQEAELAEWIGCLAVETALREDILNKPPLWMVEWSTAANAELGYPSLGPDTPKMGYPLR